MVRTVRGIVVLGLVLGIASAFVRAEDDKDGLVDNPMYKFWANFKAGATATLVETTKLHGAEKENLPGGVDSKTVTYKLASVNAKQVVVTTTVVEDEFLGTVESAPTKLTYPAKVSKSRLQAVLQELGENRETKKATVKMNNRDLECNLIAGTSKKGNTVVEFEFIYSDSVPGGVVKRKRTTKDGDKVVAETTIELKSFAEPKVVPKKDKDKAKDKKKDNE